MELHHHLARVFILTLALIGPALNSYISNFAGNIKHGHGLEQCVHKFRESDWSAVGWIYLRYQHRISILQRRRDSPAWIAGQLDRIAKAGVGQLDA